MKNTMNKIVEVIESSQLINPALASVLSESATAGSDSRSIATQIVELLTEGTDAAIVSENSELAIGMIQNMLATNKGLLSENSGVNLKLITASVATLFRQPYVCHNQKMFNTEVTATPEVVIETITHKIKSPNQSDPVPVYEAFAAPGAFTTLNSTKVTAISRAGAGVNCKTARVDLINGQPAAMRVNRTIKLEGIQVKLIAEPHTEIAANKITLKRGCSPYMDLKDGQINATFVVEIAADNKPEVTVSCKIAGDRYVENMTVSYLNATHEVTAFFFDATLSSEEHTHPITLGVENDFRSYPIGTREHIEVGETIEKIIFSKKSTGSELSGVDIMAILADRLTDTAFRVKNDRLAAVLKEDTGWLTGTLTLKQPGTSQFFKLEDYINDYFFNQLDSYCTILKLVNNFENCHFVAEISPVLAQYINAEKRITSGEGDGKTAFAYELKFASKANKITFVVAPQAPMNQVRLNLIPDDTKKTPFRTYDNFEFDSFMTDKLRRHDNPTHSAIVYSEISQEYVHNAFSVVLKVDDIPSLSDAVKNKITAANSAFLV